MIDSKEISIVLQGPIYKDITNRVCQRMRDLFPEAEIILSTWEGSDTQGLLYDVLVENKDPGGTPLLLDGSSKKTNNVDRMITSSKNGIKKATRKYTLRWRTDLLLKNSAFLEYFDKYKARADEWKIFKKRVLVHNPTLPYIYPLGPTDISCFGLTEDVLTYWDLPLQTKEDANYFLTHKYPEDNLIAMQYGAPRRGAECYVWYNVLKKFEKKYGPINFSFSFDFNQELQRLSELTIVNNLQVLSRDKFDFEALAHPYLLTASKTFITEEMWMFFYKKYCNKTVRLLDFKYHLTAIKLLLLKCKYVIPLRKSLKYLRSLKLKKAYREYQKYRKKYYGV